MKTMDAAAAVVVEERLTTCSMGLCLFRRRLAKEAVEDREKKAKETTWF